MNIVETGYYKGFGSAYLVRGLGKRAIRVILRPCHSRSGFMSEEYIVGLAAKYAVKKGWKTIWAEPDQLDGDSVVVFNTHQYWYEQNQYGYFGKYLCMVDDGPYEILNDKEFLDDCRYYN